jgi:cob(I)alamin adenosyltransferase
MIYTKTGDKGTTSLIGGKRVKKYSIRVESYGTLDELNSHLGLIRDLIIKRDRKKGKTLIEAENNPICVELLKNINILFKIQSIVASSSETKEEQEEICNKMWLSRREDIQNIEKSIDEMEAKLPKLKSFVLPTGYYISSHIHICRTICRRAERQLCRLNDESEVCEQVLIYINRLSDYLFCLARYLMIQNKRDEILFKF